MEDTLRGFIEETKEKVRNVFMPVRVAVCGRKYSPGLFETLEVIGKEETLKRLKNAIEFLKKNI
jgi:glutamyl-tRNA synthetase